MRNLAVGVDLGGTSIKAGLVSNEAGLLSRTVCDTKAHEGPAAVLDRICSLVSQSVTDLVLKGPIPVGIGCPGSVNWERSSITKPPNFPHWGVVHMKHEMESRLSFPTQIVVENDANVAALGSARFGAGKQFSSFIMVTLGTGVGGAIIYNGSLFRGCTGAAGELGHMTIDYEGPLAKSGVAGAIEAFVGQRYLSRRARYILEGKPESLVHDLMSQHSMTTITPEILFEAATKGDATSIELFSWAGQKLGAALGSAVNLLDIRKIVVGGGISSAGVFLLEPARASLFRFVSPALRDDLELVQETLGNDVGVLGAAALAFSSRESVMQPFQRSSP